MKYYQVKKEGHDVPMGKGSPYKFVANELITLKETEKYKTDKDRLNKYCELVEVNKNKTYRSFGARFINPARL